MAKTKSYTIMLVQIWIRLMVPSPSEAVAISALAIKDENKDPNGTMPERSRLKSIQLLTGSKTIVQSLLFRSGPLGI